MQFFEAFSVLETVRSFISLFIVIDILGSIPIILDLRAKDRQVHPSRATILAFMIMVAFFYVGDMVLRLFSVDIHSFAMAGAIILLIMALEMILDVEIFKNQGPTRDATLVPLVFPLLAGSATFTTLLSLRAENADINILTSIILNMALVYLVIKMADRVEYRLGKTGIYVLRKFFGIILLAIAVRMFTANLFELLPTL